MEPKSVVLLEEKKPLEVVVKQEVTRGSNTCDAQLGTYNA